MNALWSTLETKHGRLLQEHGLEHFKRTINFEYGQWSVGNLRHPFIRELVKTLVKRGRIPLGWLATCDTTDLDHIVWSAETEPTPAQLRAYAVYVGLLWQLASVVNVTGLCKDEEPALGHPMPVRWRGRRITLDQAMSVIELHVIHRFAPLDQARRVVEIGAGHGRIAHALLTRFPDIDYTIVDIPPAANVSKWYLDRTLGAGRVRHLTPDQFHAWDGGTFDLGLNISSFDEMPNDIVQGYLGVLDRVLRGALYLNGYSRTSDRGGGRRGLDEMTFPAHWRLVHSGPHPATPWFVERLLLTAAGLSSRRSETV